MMNGISLACQCRLLFYIGVNSNGGRENDGRDERETEREGGGKDQTQQRRVGLHHKHVLDVKGEAV